jgi:hypothetical protein
VPEPADIARATKLSHLVQYATLAVLVTAMLLRDIKNGADQ